MNPVSSGCRVWKVPAVGVVCGRCLQGVPCVEGACSGCRVWKVPAVGVMCGRCLQWVSSRRSMTEYPAAHQINQ